MTDGQSPSWSSPSQSGPPRRHLILIAVLVVAGAGALGGLAVIAVSSRGPFTAPVAPSTTTAAVTSPSPSPTPAGASPEAEPLQPGRRVDMADLAQQVAEIRQLPLRRRLRARVLDETALAQKVSALAFSELDAAEVAADERLLVALRLAPPDTDLAEIVEGLYREQILGLYVPEERTLYVRGGADRVSAAQRITSAHEITHALQDQSFDLVALQEAAEDDSEASLALLSLIEGDAVLTQQLWSEQHQTPAQRQEAMRDTSTESEALAAAPDYLRASLFFPYQQGTAFVLELFSSGGYAAVDAAFANPPTTSEQILHPDKYQAGEDADPVRVRRRPGGGWERDARYPLGEFDLQQLFSVLGTAQATAAAEGWGGGEIRSWTRDGGTAVAMALSFDTSHDAKEACDAIPRWYSEVAHGQQAADNVYRGDGDHLALECQDARVAVGLAEGAALARRLAGLD